MLGKHHAGLGIQKQIVGIIVGGAPDKLPAVGKTGFLDIKGQGFDLLVQKSLRTAPDRGQRSFWQLHKNTPLKQVKYVILFVKILRNYDKLYILDDSV